MKLKLKTIDGTFSFVFAMLIASTIGLVVQGINVDENIIVFNRYLFGSTILGIIVLLFKRDELKCIGDEWWKVLLCGIFLTLDWKFLFAAFHETSVTVAISVYYLSPIFVMIFGIIFSNAGCSWPKLCAIFLSFIGVLFLGDLKITSIFNTNGSGILYALLAAMFYGLFVITASKITKLSPITLAFGQFVVGLIIMAPFVDTDLLSLVYKSDFSNKLLLLGIVHTAFMYLFLMNGINKVSIGAVALMSFLDPFFAVILDQLINYTNITFYQWIGIWLGLVGIGIKTAEDRRLLKSYELWEKITKEDQK